MQHDVQPTIAASPPRRSPFASAVRKFMLHLGCLVIAIGCLAAYAHFKASGQASVSWGCLAAGAVFGFMPLRDLIRVVFAIEGRTLHLVHALGGIALLALPLAGFVSGTPVLTAAARAPFAIMGAAQALMHQNHPRNAQQAAAMQRFAASLPEIAAFTGSKDLSSPANAQRAIAALADIIAKAQALGNTELDSDPEFQNALNQVSTRFGAKLGLDAVDLALGRLAGVPGTAGAVADLRKQLAVARQTLEATGTRRTATHG
jgi:hypothetical protein